MKKQQSINLENLVQQVEITIQKPNMVYCLFAVERCIYLPVTNKLKNYFYRESPLVRKKFNRLLQDDAFLDLNYIDVVGGPFNKEKKYKIGKKIITEKYDASYWEKEIADELRKREPENLVFYLRRDPTLIAARILILVQDFYGGLTNEEAIIRYGKKTFDNMREHMTGITLIKDYDGKIRIPYSDLNYAFKKCQHKE
jgi:hypothetical protein